MCSSSSSRESNDSSASEGKVAQNADWTLGSQYFGHIRWVFERTKAHLWWSGAWRWIIVTDWWPVTAAGDRLVLQSFAPSCLTQGIMMWKRSGNIDPTKSLGLAGDTGCCGVIYWLFFLLWRPCKQPLRRGWLFESLQLPSIHWKLLNLYFFFQTKFSTEHLGLCQK